jgi:hypothetical protein
MNIRGKSDDHCFGVLMEVINCKGTVVQVPFRFLKSDF